MPKSNTQFKNESGHVQASTLSPKESTISLIKQFARIYSCERLLQPGLRNFIPN